MCQHTACWLQGIQWRQPAVLSQLKAIAEAAKVRTVIDLSLMRMMCISAACSFSLCFCWYSMSHHQLHHTITTCALLACMRISCASVSWAVCKQEWGAHGMSFECIPDRVLDHAKWQLHADQAIRDQFCGHQNAFEGA